MRPLFPCLPERTRLFRLLSAQAPLTLRFLAAPTVFGVCDSYGIELMHPKREGRSAQQIGRKGLSNQRWIVGAKLCLLLNARGQVVSWQAHTANVYDAAFHQLIAQFQEQMIVLCDGGFHTRHDDPTNPKVCSKGKWNERMLIEIVFSLFTGVLRLKKLVHRVWPALQARLAYAITAYSLCIAWSGSIKLQLAPFAL